MPNKLVVPANTSKYQHYLCEIIIKFLYGKDADTEKYKAYHGAGKSYERLQGVDITQFDYTAEKHLPKYQVEYDDKVAEALVHAKFNAKYGDLHMHDVGESMFKATIDSKAYKNSKLDKSILCIYPK